MTTAITDTLIDTEFCAADTYLIGLLNALENAR